MTFYRHASALALLLSVAAVAHPALAQADDPIEVGKWQVFGTTPAFGQDPGVPGRGYVQVAPRLTPGKPWSSGAGMVLPRPIAAGERVTVLFWARSARSADVPVTIQGGPPNYTAFAASRIAVSPRWQRHMIVGVAPSHFAAGSQSLTVQLGQVRHTVSLGPVFFLRGAHDLAAVDRAAERFRPVQLAEDVRIASDPGVELAGTLRLPARTGGAPYPVVILLAGHGPWPRGGFPLLVDRLTAAGIATLDYDKRGIGQSTGVHLDTMESTRRDAAAAVAYLRTRQDIDTRRIALLGLSQGGVIAPAVAAADPQIAAVVMLAGPAGERGTMFLDAMRATLVSGETRRDAIKPIITAAAAFMDAHATDAPAHEIRPREEALRAAFLAGGHSQAKVAGFIATLGNPVVVSQYRVAANDALRAIKAPVLALYAIDDDVVLTAQSLPQAKVALSANADATVTALPRVNHTFQRLEARADGKPVFFGSSVSDPTTLNLVTSWLQERLRPPR
ncbi:alpha/beta hydrolase family protein [Sphingomonas sp. 1P08PE]|uniref:alpha/beta hydrolase family protein n=1 Tax=Sphingomonas sp. 1P08PE TaxID=554122 RepID=UPI00399FCDFB